MVLYKPFPHNTLRKSPMKKTYYKVVKHYFVSARSPQQVQYKVGEFVKSKYEGTPLCVFDTLKNAKRFREYPFEHIYECEVKGIYRKPWIPYYNWSNKALENISCRNFLSIISDRIKRHKKISHLVHTQLPQGTVCVREVKLLRKVD